MTKFKVGDRVRPINGAYERFKAGGVVVPVSRGNGLNWWGEEVNAVRWDNYDDYDGHGDHHYAYSKDLELVTEADPTSPSHYAFPGGAEVIDISQWLTSNAAQAVQYIARSSRIDGKNKGDTVEDLRKAQVFIDFELKRLGAQ